MCGNRTCLSASITGRVQMGIVSSTCQHSAPLFWQFINADEQKCQPIIVPTTMDPSLPSLRFVTLLSSPCCSSKAKICNRQVLWFEFMMPDQVRARIDMVTRLRWRQQVLSGCLCLTGNSVKLALGTKICQIMDSTACSCHRRRKWPPVLTTSFTYLQGSAQLRNMDDKATSKHSETIVQHCAMAPESRDCLSDAHAFHVPSCTAAS